MTNVKRRVIENYTLHQLLGQGVYGKVYKAKNKQNPEEFAIKVIPVKLFMENKKLEECTVNQINTLSSIRSSPHIVKYIEMLKTSNNFYFVYEYCNGGTLESLLKKEKILKQKQALEVFKELVQAFKVLIEYNIMHRDIKPDNILFHDGIVKLGDFGFCKNLESDNAMTSTMLGSPIYMAPEVLKGQDYSTKADVWSLGVVLFQILFGYCPFESNSIANLISTIKESNLKMPLQINPISEGTQYLIRKMLIKDPYQRISWQEIFSMEFFQTQSSKIKQQPKQVVEQKQKPKTLVEKKNNIQVEQSPLGKCIERSISKKQSDEQKQIMTQPKPSKKQYQAQKPQLKSQQKVVKVEQKQQTKQLVSPNSSELRPQLDPVPISHSLSWQNDTGFKNYLANVTTTPHSKPSKISVDASLPSEINSTNKIGNIDNFFKNQNNVLESISQSVSNSVSQSINQSISNSINNNYSPLPQISPKRKQIILEHQLCTRGIKIAIDIINVQQNITLTYSYLLLTKIESKLRRIQDSILSTQTQLQDIYFSLQIQLSNLQKSILELKDQLVQQDINIKNLDNPKEYLAIRFKQIDTDQNLRLWHDMIWVLFGDSKISIGWSRDKEREEMIEYIKGKLL